MILTKNIKFKDFKFKSSSKKIKNFLVKLLESENEIIRSLNKSYKDSYLKKDLKKFTKYSDVVLIGMGGSILGARSNYNFLKHKKNEVDLKAALIFGIPTIIGIYVTRRFGVPLIPDVLFEIGSLLLTNINI